MKTMEKIREYVTGKIITYTTATAISLTALTGCFQNNDKVSVFYNQRIAEGYDVEITQLDNPQKGIIVNIGKYTNDYGFDRDTSLVYGLIYAYDIDGDKKVDEIRIKSMPEGSPLKKIANAERIDDIITSLVN
jgi:hypothetical protein